MTILISETSIINENLEKKLHALEEFKNEINLDEEIFKKIRQFIYANLGDVMINLDFKSLVDEVPSTLKEEILYFQYGVLIKKMNFFKDQNNLKFIWDFLQHMNKALYHRHTEIYIDNGLSDVMFFINYGQVNLLNELGKTFHSFKGGEHFGHAEMFCNSKRNGTAVPHEESLIYLIKKYHVERVLKKYPLVRL